MTTCTTIRTVKVLLRALLAAGRLDLPAAVNGPKCTERRHVA